MAYVLGSDVDPPCYMQRNEQHIEHEAHVTQVNYQFETTYDNDTATQEAVSTEMHRMSIHIALL